MEDKEMIVAYIRVSTLEQNEARQLEALKNYEVEKIYSEKLSGKNTDRPEFQKMMDFVREGDTIIVNDLTRLSRNTVDLFRTVEELDRKGVKLVSLKEGTIDTSTPSGKLWFSILAVLAEFERENIRLRQAEGIAIAKAQGKYKGRPVTVANNETEVLELVKKKQISVTKAAELMSCTRGTVYNKMKRLGA